MRVSGLGGWFSDAYQELHSGHSGGESALFADSPATRGEPPLEIPAHPIGMPELTGPLLTTALDLDDVVNADPGSRRSVRRRAVPADSPPWSPPRYQPIVDPTQHVVATQSRIRLCGDS